MKDTIMRQETVSERASASTKSASSPANEYVCALLANYPELNHDETEQLIQSYLELTPVEFAMLSSDHEMAKKLERFRADYRARTKTPFNHYGVLLGIALIGLAIFAWAMMLAASP